MKIADDGEILVRPNVMMGYDPENRRGAEGRLDPHWRHRGDRGRFLRITDRRRNSRSGGKYVAPTLPSTAQGVAFIEQVAVVGSHLPCR